MNVSKFLLEKAVWWDSPLSTGDGLSFDPPVEIDCRWTNRQEKYLAMAGGLVEERLSRAVVLTTSVVEVGDRLKYGVVDDLEGAGTPQENEGLEVKSVKEIKDIRSNVIARKLWL